MPKETCKDDSYIVHEKNKVIVLTERYPFEESEKAFLESEIDELAKKYQVIIVSHWNNSEYDRKSKKLDENVSAINFQIKLSKLDFIVGAMQWLFSKDGQCELKDILSKREKIAVRILDSVRFCKMADKNRKLMREYSLLDDSVYAYYSYWNTYWAYCISKKEKKKYDIKLIVRMHGYDLYEYRNPCGRQPYRKIVDDLVDANVFQSNYGRDYYDEIYRRADKHNYVSLIGSDTPDSIPIKEDQSNFTLVSCSNVLQIKRIELIISALSMINDRRITWIHIGDGENMDNISRLGVELANKNTNIQVQLIGRLTNAKVHKFYEQKYVDAFITASSTEGGCPVSIQEAMSYGIPIIATSVGGITEMIDGNGILLDANPTVEAISNAIKAMVDMSESQITAMRYKSKELWAENYNINRNAKAFTERFFDAE